MKVPFPRRIKAWLVAAVCLIAVTVVAIAPAFRSRAQSPPTTYTITDLGAFSGGTESKAFAINSCGQIAGYATLSGGSKRPFFRPAGTLIDLGVLSGSGSANSLNSSGYVVGNSPTAPSNPRAFIWHDDNGNSANDVGEMQELLPAGRVGSAEDINDDGRVVGWILADGTGGSTGGFEGFVWENNTFQTFAPGTSIQPSSINNAGTIVGVNTDSVRAFVLRSGVFTEIAPFGGSGSSGRSFAHAVSEANPVHVVGTADLVSSSGPTHAFIWTDAGGIKDLGTLSGLTSSVAYNVAIVNSSVQVVGTSYNGADPAGPSARAFVWQDANGDGDGDDPDDAGEMKDLTSLISPADPTWTVLYQARSINSSGQIVGFGLKSNGETHAFLLTPPSGPPPACLPNVSVSVSPASINEDAVGSMTYTFTRSIVTPSPLTVNFSTTGTADSSDYGISSSGSVTIPANQQSATVTVDPTPDSTPEQAETVILTIAANPGYIIGSPGAATGTITNEDTGVTISLSPLNVTESGASNLVYTFARTGVTTGALTVNYSVGGSATRGDDYSAPFSSSTGSVTIADGSSTATVTVDPTPDSLLEGDETVILTVTPGTGYNVGSPNSTEGKITPDAPVVYVEAGTENNPVPNAVAIDSVTFVRGPFKLTNEWNLTPSDRATRIILFTSNLGMTQADLATGILSIHIAGYGAIPLANIENVGPITGVPGLNASYIIVKLPADLPNPSPGPNNLTLTVKMGSAESNATLLSITP